MPRKRLLIDMLNMVHKQRRIQKLKGIIRVQEKKRLREKGNNFPVVPHKDNPLFPFLL